MDEVGYDALCLLEQELDDVRKVQDLPENLIPTTCIKVNGMIKDSCSRFAVNLICDKRPNADIAFHLNPRLAERYVVRNCRINGQWGVEETTSLTKFDLAPNKEFQFNIFITDGEFLVSLNGKHICGFRFRLPLSKVKAIDVDGLVEVYSIEYVQLQIYPELNSVLASPFTVPQGKGQDEISIQQLDMPVTGLLPGGFQQGWQLEIYGRVKILPYAFYINLQEGVQLWPHPVIPLHLNPRFSTKMGQRIFVRNAWIDGSWGQEERTPGFQFSPGSPFSIAIRRHGDHFSVWVDGQLAGEFKFRKFNDQIDVIHIQGDVVIQNLYMNEQIDDTYFNNKQKITF